MDKKQKVSKKFIDFKNVSEMIKGLITINPCSYTLELYKNKKLMELKIEQKNHYK